MRSIRDGLYGVRFVNGPVNFGSSTITLRDGALNGGDHGVSYQGRLDEDIMADSFFTLSGHIQVRRWHPQVPPVISGATDYRLDVVGLYYPQTHSIELQGTSPSFPNTVLKISGTWLADQVG